MGYLETEGIILSRRDIFEDDQEVFILTPAGGLKGRAPHARGSQESYCGRLEPPNLVETRLYRAKEHSDWVVSDLDIREVFSNLLQKEDLRYHLWPLLSLYRDIFPEGERPGEALNQLIEVFRMLKDEVDQPLMVIDRLLVMLTAHSGIAHSFRGCAECSSSSAENWRLVPDRGLFCHKCSRSERGFEIPAEVIKMYREFLDNSWGELSSQQVDRQLLEELESIMYRFFHYHFDIKLDALKVRQQI